MENQKLTGQMVLFLTFISVFGNVVYIHTWIDNATDRSAWVACLAGVLLLIPAALWILYLGRLYNGSVFDNLKAGLGRIPSFVIGLGFILINVGVAVAQINIFTEMQKVFYLTYTPSWVIMLFLVMVCMVLISGGPVIFARLAQALCIISLANYFIGFSFAYPKFVHVEYIWPIFDTTLLEFVKGSLFIAGAASECLLVLFIIIRFIPESIKAYKWTYYGIAAAAAVLSLGVMIIIAMMSPELAKRVAFGGVNAARLIQIGEFIRGVEVFIIGTYQFIAIGKVSLCIYCSWSAAKTMFGLNRSRFLLIMCTLLILASSIWINSYNKAYYLAVYMGRYIILPFCILVLLLASISTAIINKRLGSATP